MHAITKLANPHRLRKLRRCRLAAALLACPCFLGCQADEAPTQLVHPSPFAQPANPREKATPAYTQASVDVAMRVDSLGRKLLAANPQIGFRPLFTAGVTPSPEVFHTGTTEIVITDSLVQQCKSDGELVAILAHELGKMVSEQEALATTVSAGRQRMPAPELRVGTGPGPEDPVYLIERAKLEKQRGPQEAPALPPDPKVLARAFLKKAGFAESNLDAAEALLKEADKHSTWERQMKNPVPPAWTKAGSAAR
jgi:hypothetical protein